MKSANIIDPMEEIRRIKAIISQELLEAEKAGKLEEKIAEINRSSLKLGITMKNPQGKK